jgi:hypothetical protein
LFAVLDLSFTGAAESPHVKWGNWQ